MTATKATAPAPPVAGIYCRVSTDEQENNASLPSQELSCRTYAAKHGYAVDENYVYQEKLSGLQYRNRPKLLSLMQALKDGLIDVVIAHDDDRLSREPAHRLHLHDEARYYGGGIRYVLREVEDTPEGELISFVRGMGSRQEVAQIKDRTKRGTNTRLASGKLWGTGVAAYGYKWGHDAPDDPDEPARASRKNRKTHYEKDAHTAPIVVRIFRWATEGVSIRGITKRLHAEGIPSPRGHEHWTMNTVRDLLHNPVYKGEARFGRTSYHKEYDRNRQAEIMKTIEHPADQHIVLRAGLIPTLVEPDVWEAVQARLALNKAGAGRPTANPEQFLLRGGFVRCGHCGQSVAPRNTDPESPRWPLYQIGRSASHVACGHSFSIAAKPLDESVWSMVKQMFSDPVVLQHKIAETLGGPDPTASERENIKAELAAIEKEQATLALNMGRVSAPSAVEALANRLDKLVACQSSSTG